MNVDDPDVRRALQSAWERAYYTGGGIPYTGKSRRSVPDFSDFLHALRDELKREFFVKAIREDRGQSHNRN